MDLKQTLWTEKYRPEKIANYVFSDTKSKNQIEQWIANRDIPHILFHGSPGTGKTTLALILVNELDIDPYDVLFINASRENSIDDMRNKITSFVSTLPFGRMKVVILDECLDENTPVVVYRNNVEQLIKIKDLQDDSDLVKSFNIENNRVEWKSFGLLYKGIQETVEIEFENREIVICTPDHKWYVEDSMGNPLVVKASELKKYGYILTD